MSNLRNTVSNLEQWKRPDEILRLHRLKQKQKALQARINRPSTRANSSTADEAAVAIVTGTKRRNPFTKNEDSAAKKQKKINNQNEATTDESIFQLLTKTQLKEAINIDAPVLEHNFQTAKILEAAPVHEEELPKANRYLPIDWSIKSRLRILCKTRIPGNNLKTCQEASGLTSFVRCIDPENSSSGLDISPGARFYQSTLYWQHPYLPWLTLFPRNSRNNNNFVLGEPERQSLANDWANSFRNLFQLVRARQCPYFYVCGNSFTVLFRAAGIGGRVETHALLTPTSRGMRAALKQEDIEFVMPLKKSTELNKSSDSGTGVHNSSFSNSSEEQSQQNADEDEDSDDDMEDDKWLESLGVEAEEIKRINYHQYKKKAFNECSDDYSDQSTVLIEGVECQAFFNFLLNAKSTTTRVGRLAGVPPTLLAPVSFTGATLRHLTTRSSTIRMDSEEYHSTELQGTIMPHILPYICNLLVELKDNFSATMVSAPSTSAFCKVSQKIIDDMDKENEQSTTDSVFGKENLSDCGLSPKILDSMCRSSKDSIFNLERIVFSKENGGYIWS